ncbi:flavodoxin family protein [Alteribacillus sp. HJP-4]|uniref:flavodoxin family protein n=1 Tax=Alteribacillus sp. HJP-4 TaxID=2775394 RepID=UPI0035CD3C35
MLALYGSSRRHGNSEYLAEKTLEEVEHRSIFLCEHDIKPIIDQRHIPGGFSEVNDDYEELFTSFLKQDTIVFVTPLYWFGMSGQMKIFFDRWSQYMRDVRFDFKKEMSKKKAYVIITGNNPDPNMSALPLIQQFQYIFDYAGIEFVDYIIGKANEPGEITADVYALKKAELWNREFSSMLQKTSLS